MAGKAQNSSAHGVLILIIPIALAIVLLFLAWPVLLALVIVGGISSVWQRYQWLKWSRQINPIFHQLIEANQGSITALDLAIKANISGEQAKRYLDAKAEEFAAQTHDREGQDTVYSFITANILGRILDESEPLGETATEPEVVAQQELVETPAEVQSQSTLTQEAAEIVEEAPPQAVAETVEEAPPQMQPPQAVAETLEESPPQEKPVFESFDDDYWAAKPEEPPSQVEPQQQSTPTPTAEPPEELLSEEEEETLEEPTPQAQKPPAESLPKTHPILQSLIQSELARRLDVHSSTVYKRRNDPDFAEWSRSRDPEGIAWEFSEDTKEFYPVETES